MSVDERPRLSGIATTQWIIGVLMAASMAVLRRLHVRYHDERALNAPLPRLSPEAVAGAAA